MKDQLMSESAKYGFAVMVLTFGLIVAGFIIVALWKRLNKTEDKMMIIINENTIAFQKLESTISMLVSILNKR